MEQGGFDWFVQEYEKVSTAELERRMAAKQVPVGSHGYNAIVHILDKRKSNLQDEKFKKDFELTKENVEATKKLANYTLGLAWATGIVAVANLILVIVTWYK